MQASQVWFLLRSDVQTTVGTTLISPKNCLVNINSWEHRHYIIQESSTNLLARISNFGLTKPQDNKKRTCQTDEGISYQYKEIKLLI